MKYLTTRQKWIYMPTCSVLILAAVLFATAGNSEASVGFALAAIACGMFMAELSWANHCWELVKQMDRTVNALVAERDSGEEWKRR